MAKEHFRYQGTNLSLHIQYFAFGIFLLADYFFSFSSIYQLLFRIDGRFQNRFLREWFLQIRRVCLKVSQMTNEKVISRQPSIIPIFVKTRFVPLIYKAWPLSPTTNKHFKTRCNKEGRRGPRFDVQSYDSR